MELEARKQQEREYHNLIRSQAVRGNADQHKYYTANRKYYSVHRSQQALVQQWWRQHLPGKRVLDYCCGDGLYAVAMADCGPLQVVGIDISDISVGNSRTHAAKAGVADRCEFQVMDAEAMTFPDNTFDVVNERGVLHHLDLARAYPTLARVLKPGGVMLCQEPIRYNPVIQLYRRLTPHLRTPWEVDHIMGKRELSLARKYFRSVRVVGFFYLTALLAVPFRKWSVFPRLLRCLEWIDRGLFKIPGVRWLAWSMVIEFADPIKSSQGQAAEG